MKYTPKSEVIMELSNPRVVNCYKNRIFSQRLYVCEGKLYKKLLCKSITCQAHNKTFRELKLQKIPKSVLNKKEKITNYEYQYYNVKDMDGRVISISPKKLDELTYAEPEPKKERTLEEVLTTPD
jgi:Trm5-related predicted tRNA methylase